MIDFGDILSLTIRSVNLMLWIVVAFRYWDSPAISPLGRHFIIAVIVTGMTVLVVGALAPYGFPGALARILYTAFTAASAIIALALIWERS